MAVDYFCRRRGFYLSTQNKWIISVDVDGEICRQSEFERISVKSTISNKLNLEYNLANWLKPKLGLGLGLSLGLGLGLNVSLKVSSTFLYLAFL
jgi:hypothetical protein